MGIYECWKCGTSINSDKQPMTIDGVDRYLCADCDPQSTVNELTRLREREAALVEAATAVVDQLSFEHMDPDQRNAMSRLEDVLATHKPASDEIGE